MRLILCSLLVLAWTSGPFFGPKPLPPSAATATPAVQPAAPTIDFDSLHSQARQALDQLRQRQAIRPITVASVN
jgi:hypothetical protein